MNTARFDIHQTITDQIIAAIEAGAGEFKIPWHRAGVDLLHPRNVSSKIAYRGVNILTLWLTAEGKGYSSGLWGTYNQWTSLGATIRKGEKAAHIVFYKQIATDSDDAEDKKTRLVARATPVFAAEQVTGYDINTPAPMATSGFKHFEEAEAFIQKTGAEIIHGGDQAYYQPSTDSIHIPRRESFIETDTSSAEENFYSVLFHEMTHYAGMPERCNRDLKGRFGSESYAMEELVAELGAAFLCGHFNISSSPRQDHAQYLTHWLSIMKSDKRAIFTAASKASQAVDFLTRETVS